MSNKRTKREPNEHTFKTKAKPPFFTSNTPSHTLVKDYEFKAKPMLLAQRWPYKGANLPRKRLGFKAKPTCMLLSFQWSLTKNTRHHSPFTECYTFLSK